MSGISGLSGSGLNTLFDYLSKPSSSDPTSAASDVGDRAETPLQNPKEFLTAELEKQGYTGTALADLQAKIESAVEATVIANNGIGDPKAIHEAINEVLKEAGADTAAIDKDAQVLRAAGHHHHRHHHAQSTSSDASAASDDSIDALLKQLGVDPTDFNSALQNARREQSRRRLDRPYTTVRQRPSRLAAQSVRVATAQRAIIHLAQSSMGPSYFPFFRLAPSTLRGGLARGYSLLAWPAVPCRP